ncbi:MAG: CopD family protein [Anaerolineae bacterium]|nr:CopD family protein [Anaerolineae bacterium]
MSIEQRLVLRPSLLITLLMLVLGVRPAAAHGFLIRAIPDDRAVLERAPVRLQYWFSEGLEPAFSSITVRDQTGTIIAEGGVTPENTSLLAARLPRGLRDGAYIVDMRIAFASDGHVIAQSSVFFIGQAVGGVAGSAANTQADPLEVIWRGLALSSTMLLFGMFAVYSGILLPAWGNPAFRAGGLPPRVMHRINWVIAIGLVIAFAAGVMALLQQAMTFFNTDLSAVISQQLWSVTRVGTRFGEIWSGRMLLLGAVAVMFGLSLYFREEQPENVRPFLSANLWAMALVIGSFSIGSHGAGSLMLPWVAVFNDWLHGLAVGFWAGGVAALALMLPSALAPLEGDARRLALLAVMRRFSRWAVAALVIVISSGIYSATNWFYTPADVTQTPFGGALLFKLILVAVLVAVGATHHIALRPERYQQFEVIIRRVNNFVPTLRLEMLIVAFVLVSAGWLSATPIPVPPLANAVPPPNASQQVGDLNIILTITPGGPGVNTYDTLITKDGHPMDEAAVRLQLVHPERDWRGKWEIAEGAESGLYVAAGAEIDREGLWWSLVDVTLPDGTTQRAAFDWNITNAASVLQSRPPTIVNVLALFGVMVAVGWVLYPAAYRVYQRLDLSPAAVTVAVGAVVATVFVTVLGNAFIQNLSAEYQATLNPPPQVVNTVLPNAESLLRGQSLYAADCVGWEGRSLAELIARLPRTRDDQLFYATRDGWNGLPACNGNWTDSQRWDVVNALRTLEVP